MPEKIWKPHPRQVDFLQIPDSIFEALYGGAAGGGKSEVLILLPIIRGFYKHPRFKGILFRRTFPELESEIIIRSHEWYAACGARYNEAKHRWTFPSGAIMQFAHCEYESDVKKYDTAEYNYMAFDELTSFTMSIYMYLAFSRVRSSVKELPAIVRSATNPGNIGHSFVRKRFIEDMPYGQVGVDKLTGLKRIFIQSKVTDNPHIDPTYAAKLATLPESDRRAKLDGDWYTYEGQVFDDWRPTKLPNEPDNALHVIDPFKIPDWWTRVLAVDWGFASMMIALWGAISPDKRLYIYREYTAKQTKISEWATELKHISIGETYKRVILCKSAWQNRGDEKTLAEKFKDYSGFTPYQPDNDRVSGKLLFQEYLRWKERPKRAARSSSEFSMEFSQKILRNYGQKSYEEYLSTFIDSREEGVIPKLQVFPNCSELIKCIPLCIYDKKSSSSDKPAEDVREFDGDDPYDCGRYLIKEADQIINVTAAEGGRRSELESIERQLQETGNQTNYYMRMSFLGTGNKPQRAIRRFH